MTEQIAKPEDAMKRSGRLKTIAQFTRQKPLGAFGAAIIVVFFIAAIFADMLAPFDPLETNYGSMMQPPSFANWMGTDVFGRDILSRILYGSRTAMLIGFTTSFVAATLGAVIGVFSAYQGGTTDLLIQRVMDVILSFPLIVMALAMVAVLGVGTSTLVLAIVVPMIPRATRVVRASALSIRESLYVESAEVIGAKPSRIIYLHMLPNVMGPYLIMLTSFLGQAILLEASLSFIGLGVAEPTPAWGLMLKGAAEQFIEQAPWMSIFPGLAISLAVFGFNVFGDALRDVLDPKLRLR
ncbi:MAG: ABC transporter permease [Chloroflexota bacterium]